MTAAADQFAYWLTQAVLLIKATEGTTLTIIQDELAMALGRASGESSIRHWRKGHLPADLDEVEQLADLLADRGGLSRRSYEQFLRTAGHPRAQALAERRFPGQPDDAPLSAGLHRAFSPNRPITDPRRFFGRSRECRRIFNWWQREPLQDVALIGPKKSGRTSLLHFLRLIHATPPLSYGPTSAIAGCTNQAVTAGPMSISTTPAGCLPPIYCATSCPNSDFPSPTRFRSIHFWRQ